MNEELAALFEEDRADAQTFQGEEAFLASQARRYHVEQLLAERKVNTADDYFHACFIFQHGERLDHWAKAHLMARTAADLGHPRAKYMAAASYDRWLMRQGKPQKYGTNSVADNAGWRVWDYDPTTTDEERAALDVPPLSELLERVKHIEQPSQKAEQRPIFTARLENTSFEIFELASPPSLDDRPIYGVPTYELFHSSDPIPGYLPDKVELFKFGRLFGAKSLEGQVVCTWHPTTWQISDGSPVTQEEWAERLTDQPQWLDEGNRYWRRLGLVRGVTNCWIVGGILPSEELVKIATSLF